MEYAWNVRSNLWQGFKVKEAVSPKGAHRIGYLRTDSLSREEGDAKKCAMRDGGIVLRQGEICWPAMRSFVSCYEKVVRRGT